MSDANAIAESFIKQYYLCFDTDRSQLASLYRDESTMTFEGALHNGAQAITQKLCGLPFQTVQHSITAMDSCMTIDNGLLVFVIGQLKTDNDPIHGFSQCFYLKQVGDSLFVLNDIFRLHLHNIAS